VPGPSFSADGAFEHFLRLPFTLPEPDLEEAVRTLAALAARLGASAVEEPAGVV
jgi:DNA-binding transcriptional MocR family regulator